MTKLEKRQIPFRCWIESDDINSKHKVCFEFNGQIYSKIFDKEYDAIKFQNKKLARFQTEILGKWHGVTLNDSSARMSISRIAL